MELMPGYKQTQLGVIPTDWEDRRLGEVGEALIGLTYKPTEVREYGILVLRSSNIQNDALAFDDNVYVCATVPDRIMVRPGDVLICVRNGSRDLIGKSAYLDERTRGMTFGAFMAVHRGSLGRLVSYLFQSEILKRQIREHLGATINQITNRSLDSFRIPVPPTEREQRAIADALSDVDALLSGLDRLIAKKRDLNQAAMQQLLTGQTRLPGFGGEWDVKELGQVAQFRTGPFGSALHKSDYTSAGVPVINPMHITDGDIEPTRTMTITESAAAALSEFRLKVGEIVIGRRGDMGRCAVVRTHQEGWLCGTGSMIVRCSSGIDADFLQRVLSSPPAIAAIVDASVGTTMVNLNQGTLAALKILFPSLPEQSAIATVLSDMDAELTALEARRDKTHALKQAMMQELLTGRIRLVPSAVEAAVESAVG